MVSTHTIGNFHHTRRGSSLYESDICLQKLHSWGSSCPWYFRSQTRRSRSPGPGPEMAELLDYKRDMGGALFGCFDVHLLPSQAFY